MRLIIGEKYTDEIRELTELGCDVITFKPNPYLDEEINSHADINFFNCYNGNIVLSDAVKGEIAKKEKIIVIAGMMADKAVEASLMPLMKKTDVFWPCW